MTKKWRDFHLVEIRRWPVLISLRVSNLILNLYLSIKSLCDLNFVFSAFSFIFIWYLWNRDVVRERTFSGFHTFKVKSSLKLGIILFITSEIIFFFSFFWTFFYASINPSVEIGNKWPPEGVESINPLHIPLLNTLILVSSGVSVTFRHHILLSMNFDKRVKWLRITAVLGIYFSVLQVLEYKFLSYTIMDSVFGSLFFLATGFHGLHVLIGSMMILVRILRHKLFHFSASQHVGFELTCWYWHFVDLIWLFLYLFIYWWGK